jgi:hypothetical protein
MVERQAGRGVVGKLVGEQLIAAGLSLFIVEDEMHAERMGEFSTLGEAWAEVQRLAALPFDRRPNLPPCTKGAACRRTYEITEYDDRQAPWREISRILAVELTANGAAWMAKP